MGKHFNVKVRASAMLVVLGLVSCSTAQPKETAATYIRILAERSSEARAYQCRMNQIVTDRNVALFNSLDFLELDDIPPEEVEGGFYFVTATAQKDGEPLGIFLALAETERLYQKQLRFQEAQQQKLDRELTLPTRDDYSVHKYCVVQMGSFELE